MGQGPAKPYSGDIEAEKLESVDHSVFSFYNNRGLKLFAQSWLPKSNPAGVIILVPGLGDHSGRAKGVAIELVTKYSLCVYSYDHVAHGRSEGEGIEFFSSFSILVEDLAIFVKLVQYADKNLPFFIYGHSMGGLTIIHCFQDKNFQKIFSGVVLHAPPVAVPPQATPFLMFTARTVSQVIPQQPIEEIIMTTLLRDPVAKQQYIDDPLVWHAGLRAQTGISVVDFSAAALGVAKDIQVPLMYLQGTADNIIPVEGAEPFFKQTSSMDKTFYKLKGGFHENQNDYEKNTVINLIGKWVLKKIGSKQEECSEIIEIDVTELGKS